MELRPSKKKSKENLYNPKKLIHNNTMQTPTMTKAKQMITVQETTELKNKKEDKTVKITTHLNQERNKN